MIILGDLVHICLFLFLLLVLFLGSCQDCSEICVVLFLEENVFPPLDVETNLGSTRHSVNAGAKVAECFWEVHHADEDRDDGASWIASLSS